MFGSLYSFLYPLQTKPLQPLSPGFACWHQAVVARTLYSKSEVPQGVLLIKVLAGRLPLLEQVKLWSHSK